MPVDLSDYLFIRSTGHIGSLMELIRRGCAKAIRTGTESLNQKLFDSIKIDSAAEAINAFERASGTLPGAREVAVAFADLVGFTLLVNSYRRKNLD